MDFNANLRDHFPDRVACGIVEPDLNYVARVDLSVLAANVYRLLSQTGIKADVATQATLAALNASRLACPDEAYLGDNHSNGLMIRVMQLVKEMETAPYSGVTVIGSPVLKNAARTTGA